MVEFQESVMSGEEVQQRTGLLGSLTSSSAYSVSGRPGHLFIRPFTVLSGGLLGVDL